MTALEFWFDFGSPNAYFAWKVLPEIEARHGVSFRRRPLLLGGVFKATGNQSPIFAFANIPAKMAYTGKEMIRFARHHGVKTFKMNPHFPVNTLLLMRGAMVAERDGELEAYMSAIMPAMWEDGLKMDDPPVVLEVLDNAGLDSAKYAEGTADSLIKQALVDATQEAVERGIFGIPTFFVGEEMFFGKDSLPAVEKELTLVAS